MSMQMTQSTIMRPEMAMTARMVMAMNLLQMPTLELDQELTRLASTNPTLELHEPTLSTEQLTATPDTTTATLDTTASETNDYRRSEELDRALPDDNARPYRSSSSPDDEEYDQFAIICPKSPPLAEQLKQQLFAFHLTKRESALAELIIDNLDDNGYLRRPLEWTARGIAYSHLTAAGEEQAKKLESDKTIEALTDNTLWEIENWQPPVTQDELEDALWIVQQLSPSGVGARDLRECLLLQLQKRTDPDSLLATEILRKHADDLENNRLPLIARNLNVSLEQIKAALLQLRGLNPYPGESQDNTSAGFRLRRQVSAEAAPVRVDLVARLVPRQKEASVSRLHQAEIVYEEKASLDENLTSAVAFTPVTDEFLTSPGEEQVWEIRLANGRTVEISDIYNECFAGKSAVNSVQPDKVVPDNNLEAIYAQADTQTNLTTRKNNITETDLDESDSIEPLEEETQTIDPTAKPDLFSNSSLLEQLNSNEFDALQRELRQKRTADNANQTNWAENTNLTEVTTEHTRTEPNSLKECYEQAKWLVDALKQRDQTLLAVASQVVLRQSAYLRGQSIAPAPLGMKEIADALNLHNATISRAVSGKWLQAPIGIVSLRSLFSRAVGDNNPRQAVSSSAELSSRKIKARLQELIDQEDKKNPLKDDQLADLLQQEGMSIHRRTVAKYRDSLGINSHHKRREY